MPVPCMRRISNSPNERCTNATLLSLRVPVRELFTLNLPFDLSATSFLRVLRRFFGRRGLPTLLISDNRKTFKDAEVKKFVLNRNIDWKFNVPTASWWGGFFEICVKLVKRCLKKVLGNAKLSYEELESVLIETKGVLNSIPLTYVYDELT